jgi:hypothetical protein
MKKLVLLAALAVISVNGIYAQPRAIGLRLGGNQELTYQQYVGHDNTFLQIDVGSFYFQGIQVEVTYNWLFGGAEAFSTYAGFGVGAGFNFQDNAWYARVFNDPETTNITSSYTCIRRYFFAGVIGQFGLEYKFDNIPITLSLDYRPMIGCDVGKKGLKTDNNDVIPYPGEKNKIKLGLHAPGLWDFGIGVKYRF